jgi:hypothetical protein
MATWYRRYALRLLATLLALYATVLVLVPLRSTIRAEVVPPGSTGLQYTVTLERECQEARAERCCVLASLDASARRGTLSSLSLRTCYRM